MTTITLPTEWEDALREQSESAGTTPEQFALDAVLQRLAPLVPRPSVGQRLRLLRGLAVDTGISLTNEQASSESYYD